MLRNLVGVGMLLVISLFGTMSAPTQRRLAQTTGKGLRQQLQTTGRRLVEIQSAFHILPSRLADYIADALIGAGVVLLILFVNLLVFVPFQINSIHHRITKLEEQIGWVRREVSQTSTSLIETTQHSRSRRWIEGDIITTKSPPDEVPRQESPSQQGKN